jgi:hypothetical protein
VAVRRTRASEPARTPEASALGASSVLVERNG